MARLALARGDLSAARRWLDVYGDRSADDALLSLQELEDLTAARWHIRQGDRDAALQKVTRWHKHALAQGRGRTVVEVQTLEALAHAAGGEDDAALEALSAALEQAQAADYRRLFINEGELMAGLLRSYVTAGDFPFTPYARLLLHHFMRTPAAAGIDPAAVQLEPLSDHEQRVLRLLAAGLTYGEIAEERIVSINTIKTQVKSITASSACTAARKHGRRRTI